MEKNEQSGGKQARGGSLHVLRDRWGLGARAGCEKRKLPFFIEGAENQQVNTV